MKTKNYALRFLSNVILACAILLHISMLKSSQTKAMVQQPVTCGISVLRKNLQDIDKPIAPDIISSFAATIIKMSTENSDTSDDDSDDEDSPETTIFEITPRKGTSAPLKGNNHNSRTVLTFIKEMNYLASLRTLSPIDFDSLAPTKQDLLTLPRRLIPIESAYSNVGFSKYLHYLLVCAKNKKLLTLYKFDDFIATLPTTDIQIKAPEGQHFASYDFLLNDMYLRITYDDGSSQVLSLKDSRKSATQTNCTYPSSGKLITYSDAFKPNNIPLLKDREVVWSIMSRRQEDELSSKILSKKELFGVVFTKIGPKSIKIALPEVGVLDQINAADIENYSIWYGDPIVMCCDTTDGDCHVAIVQSDTIIPVISGVNQVIRGPQDYILVQIKKNQNFWFLLKLGPINAPHASATSPTTSASNTLVLSATPSPATSQSCLATITDSNFNSPSTPRTGNLTPTTPESATSASTSSVSVCTAPATSPITPHKYPTYIGDFSPDNSLEAWRE